MIEVVGFEALRSFDIAYGVGAGQEVTLTSRQDLLEQISDGMLVGRSYQVQEPSPLQAALIGHRPELGDRAIECVDEAARRIVKMVRGQETVYTRTVFRDDATHALARDWRVADEYEQRLLLGGFR